MWASTQILTMFPQTLSSFRAGLFAYGQVQDVEPAGYIYSVRVVV